MIAVHRFPARCCAFPLRGIRVARFHGEKSRLDMSRINSSELVVQVSPFPFRPNHDLVIFWARYGTPAEPHQKTKTGWHQIPLVGRSNEVLKDIRSG